MGAIRACLDRGWTVPGDVSVVGWDDNEQAAVATPSVSTVAVDAEGLGRDAMSELIALVRGQDAPAPTAGPLHTLVLRESTGPARRPVTG
ncbi:substrate-binding domain-containing protein [Propioniciclava coleopterorum]|uniref:substrate-binding domain-containing protein n=1 Tax=Propioniciclava coleopterorum TaxID=2714937 RepID=UPI00197F115A